MIEHAIVRRIQVYSALTTRRKLQRKQSLLEEEEKERERLLSLEGYKNDTTETKVANQNCNTIDYNSLRMRLRADTSGRGRR